MRVLGLAYSLAKLLALTNQPCLCRGGKNVFFFDLPRFSVWGTVYSTDARQVNKRKAYKSI